MAYELLTAFLLQTFFKSQQLEAMTISIYEWEAILLISQNGFGKD